MQRVTGRRLSVVGLVVTVVTAAFAPPAFAQLTAGGDTDIATITSDVEDAVGSVDAEQSTTAPSAGVAEATTGADPIVQADAQQEEETEAAASATGSVVDLDVAGTDVLTVGQASSNAGQKEKAGDRDESASSDAVLLSVLGHELWGAHASSEEGENSREGLLLSVTDQICSGSNGQICVSLLYAESKSSRGSNSQQKSVASVCAGGSQKSASHECDGPVSATVGYAGAEASEDERSTSSSSDTAALDLCVGSQQHSAGETCDGPVGARVADSHSSASSERESAQAGADNSTADVCVGGEDAKTGTCKGVGVVLLHSESASSASVDEKPTSDNRAFIVALEAQGEEQFALSSEGTVSLPPGCPDPSLVCIDLNQTGSDATARKVSGAATAIGIDVGKGALGDDSLLSGSVNDAQSGVDLPDEVEGIRIKPPERSGGEPVGDGPRVLGAPKVSGGPQQLPFTGSDGSLITMMGLGLIALGLALQRRANRAAA